MKRIGLIGYTPDYFLGFGRALEQAGFEAFWINSRRSDCEYLRQCGVPEKSFLDTATFDPSAHSLEECKAALSVLDSGDGPRINDIILMDRILRKKPYEFAILYLAHLQRVVAKFIIRHDIKLVTSGRDTALQLLTMQICRHLSVAWVVPTRVRIPQEMYGFCQSHHTESLLRFREITPDDRAWAANFLSEFSEKSLRPALKKSVRGFGDVLRLLPVHAKVFLREARKARIDVKNDYSRYTIPSLMRMYLVRRLNLFHYNVSPPYRAPSDKPFCLYAMHTQPESSIDVVGSYFSDQTTLITFIARSLPVNHELYVKIHPTDVDGRSLSFYSGITRIPGVRLISHAVDSRELIVRASIIFSISGTIAYEAGLMGKPAITFARNFFNKLPTVFYCEAPPHLPNLIASLLTKERQQHIREQLLDFLAEIRASSFDGEVNRTYGTDISPLSDDDILVLKQAYVALYRLLVDPNKSRCIT